VTITGSGFGNKSRAAGSILHDKCTGTVGTVDPLLWEAVNLGTGADIPYNMQLRALSFAPTGNAIGVPHPYINKFYAGAHNITSYPYQVYLAKQLNVPANGGNWVVYAGFWVRNDPAWTFSAPGDENYKFIGWNLHTLYDGNSVLLVGGTNQPAANTDAHFQVVMLSNNQTYISLEVPDANGHGNFWGGGLNPMNPAYGWIFREVEIFITTNTGAAGGGYWQYRENGGPLLVDYRGKTEDPNMFFGTIRYLQIGDSYTRDYRYANNYVYLADAYIDITDGQRSPGTHVARVMMRDIAGHVSPQDIVSWSDGSVSFNCWPGACQAGAVQFEIQPEQGALQIKTGYTLA
jgi:hypothetical protein